MGPILIEPLTSEVRLPNLQFNSQLHNEETLTAQEDGDAGPIEPFLKWPGGKRALLPGLSDLLPKSFGRYFEPFLGGGALYFHLRPKRALLADKNIELIGCYTVLRDHPDELIRRLRRLRNDADTYYRVRRSLPRSEVSKAARFMYLANLSFNGIYRVNFEGHFNVPYGHRAGRPVFDADRLRRSSRTLQGVKLVPDDFEVAVRTARATDLVYLDPPYTVAHSNNGFIRYNAKLFSWDDQQRLARVASDLAARGCHVIVSNASHPPIRALYPGFSVYELERRSNISARAASRTQISEYVFATAR
jgi:DNA adenine methylase